VTDAAGELPVWHAPRRTTSEISSLRICRPASSARGHRAVRLPKQTAEIRPPREVFAKTAPSPRPPNVVNPPTASHSELRPHVLPAPRSRFHGTTSYRGPGCRAKHCPYWPWIACRCGRALPKHFPRSSPGAPRCGEMATTSGSSPGRRGVKESRGPAPATRRCCRRRVEPNSTACGIPRPSGKVRETGPDRTFRLGRSYDPRSPRWPTGPGPSHLGPPGDAAATIAARTFGPGATRRSRRIALRHHPRPCRTRPARPRLPASPNERLCAASPPSRGFPAFGAPPPGSWLRVDSMVDGPLQSATARSSSAHAEFRKHLYFVRRRPHAEGCGERHRELTVGLPFATPTVVRGPGWRPALQPPSGECEPALVRRPAFARRDFARPERAEALRRSSRSRGPPGARFPMIDEVPAAHQRKRR